MITLKQTIDIMNKIKDNNDEIEIFVDSEKGIPHFVIQEKIITLNGGVENGI